MTALALALLIPALVVLADDALRVASVINPENPASNSAAVGQKGNSDVPL